MRSDALLRDGNALVRDGNLVVAREKYRSARAAATDDRERALAVGNEAVVAIALGDDATATTLCARAWSYDEGYARATTRLEALLTSGRGSFEDAIEGAGEKGRALEIAKRARDAGNEAFRAGDYEKAMQAYGEGLETCAGVPGAGILFSNRAACKMRVGDASGALADAEAALARDESFVKAKMRKAAALMALGRHREADAVYDALVFELPGDEDLVRSANEARRTLGKSERKAGARNVEEWSEYQALVQGAKLVFVDFTATWCGPCKMIGPTFVSLSTKFPRAHFIKVDVDAAQEIAGQERVSSMPTFAVYMDGNKVETFSGADANRLTQMVSKHYANARFR